MNLQHSENKHNKTKDGSLLDFNQLVAHLLFFFDLKYCLVTFN